VAVRYNSINDFAPQNPQPTCIHPNMWRAAMLAVTTYEIFFPPFKLKLTNQIYANSYWGWATHICRKLLASRYLGNKKGSSFAKERMGMVQCLAFVIYWWTLISAAACPQCYSYMMILLMLTLAAFMNGSSCIDLDPAVWEYYSTRTGRQQCLSEFKVSVFYRKYSRPTLQIVWLSYRAVIGPVLGPFGLSTEDTW
jgi:hypothetical protein